MKRYGNLYDDMRTMENLREAHRNARKDKAGYKEVQMVDKNPDYYLGKIRDMMLGGKYYISQSDYYISTIWDKTKQRELWKLNYYPHRIIQWAIMLKLEQIFNNTFCNHVCASVKGKGGKQVQKLMDKYLKDEEGTKYCLKLDIKKFYPNINHRILKKILRKKFKDKKLLKLLDMYIDSYPGRKGVPIGSYISQFLANFYLAYFDHWTKEILGIKYIIRYMDDIVILANSKRYLRYIFKRIKAYLGGRLNLTIKENYQIFPIDSRGIDFVGYRYFHGYTLLRKRTCYRMKRKTYHINYKRQYGWPLNYKEFAGAISYMGWLYHCNGWRLYEKYISPILPSLVEYYKENINESKYNRFRRRLLKLH